MHSPCFYKCTVKYDDNHNKGREKPHFMLYNTLIVTKCHRQTIRQTLHFQENDY